ncbi:MAG: hypothetical protein LBM76_03305 [Mycoplasmataceae bacterium]|nr:hypothetical protein [Mycoplasmataceae bacterium]
MSNIQTNSTNYKIIIIILSFLAWLPGLICCAVLKNNLTTEDYKVSRLTVVIIGFICFILPGIVALLVLPSKK